MRYSDLSVADDDMDASHGFQENFHQHQVERRQFFSTISNKVIFGPVEDL